MVRGLKNVAGKDISKTVKILKQVGESEIARDRGRIAKLPGKRISKTGNIYWETRKNRSDRPLRAT